MSAPMRPEYAPEIERLTARVKELEGLFNDACDAADLILAPLCEKVGKYLHDAPDAEMVAVMADYGVKIVAGDFQALYRATDRTAPETGR